MSLSKLSVDLLSSVCGFVDGVALINLVKCGSKRLNQSLSNAKMSTCFEVTHYGFLDVPAVLVSLATLFPSARSHTFLDVGTKGCPADFTRIAVIDTNRLQSIRLNVLAFAYVGGGAFIAAMNETLHELVLEGKLDDVFPQVAQWTAGRFGHEFSRSHFDIDIYQNILDPDFPSFVPSSAQYIRVSERTLFVVEPEVHVPIFESVTIGSASNVAQMAALTCYQSLTALTIVCNQPINASDLPRGLTLFTCTYGSTITYGRRVDNTWHPFLFTDAPIGLEHLRLHSRHDLVLAEDVPFKAPNLKTLDVQHLRDKGHQLSASTLPPTLTSLEMCNVRVDGLAVPLEEQDDIYLLDQHLFHNIQSNAWVDVWPTQLQLKYSNFTNQNGFGNLLDRFAPLSPFLRLLLAGLYHHQSLHWYVYGVGLFNESGCRLVG